MGRPGSHSLPIAFPTGTADQKSELAVTKEMVPAIEGGRAAASTVQVRTIWDVVGGG